MPVPAPTYKPPAGSKLFSVGKGNNFYTYSQNGTTNIVSTNGAVLATTPNGTTNYTFTTLGNSNTALKSQLSNPNSTVSKTVKSVSGTTPPGVAKSPAAPGSTAAPNNGGQTGSTTSLPSIGTRINKYDKGDLLVYPLKRKGNGGDYIKFEIRSYQKSGLQAEGTTGLGRYSTSLVGMEYRQSKTWATICLPIQSGIVDSMSVDWGSGELNPITAAFANTAYNVITSAGSGDPQKYLSTIGREAIGLGKAFSGAQGELQQLLVNYFTEQSVGVSGLLSRTIGGAINNNLELLFNGPMLRSFTFTFKLTPREPDEATLIKNIIRYFKKSMVPGLSDSKLFLLAPNVFKINYIYTGKGDKAENHPYLNRIKVAALKDFSVNYSPDGNYMTYQNGGSMTQYELSMTFAEIDPIYEPDYERGEGLTGMGW